MKLEADLSKKAAPHFLSVDDLGLNWWFCEDDCGRQQSIAPSSCLHEDRVIHSNVEIIERATFVFFWLNS